MDELDSLLSEQVAYYRAVAAEYEDHSIDLPGGEELSGALDAFRPPAGSSSLRAALGRGPGSCSATPTA